MLLRYFVVLFILIISSCKSNSKQIENTLETPEIKNDSLKIELSISDKNRFYIYDDFESLSFINQKENDFILNKPYFQLIDGKYKISYFLKKGESVEILHDELYPRPYLKDTTRNAEILFSLEYFKKFEQPFLNMWLFQRALTDKKYEQNPNLRDKIFANELDESFKFLKDYQNKYHLSIEFYSFYSAIIKYKILERKLLGGFMNNIKFPNEYIVSLINNAKNDLSNDDFLFLNNYRQSSYLLACIVEKNNTGESDFKATNNTFSGKTKDYVLAKMIINAKKGEFIRKIPAESLKDMTNDYLKECKTPEYKDYIEKSLIVDNIAFGKDELVSLKSTKVSFIQINKGQLTYIDFWASWCVPCLVEMPESKALKEEYSKRGVNFVYISMDENPAAWEKSMQRIGISDTESYLLPNGKDSEIARQYKITSIPRYMIMNKEGKIINTDAPRPADSKIRQLFEDFLKK